MPTVPYSSDLGQEYQEMFQTAIVDEDKLESIDKVIDSLTRYKSVYDTVSQGLGGQIPWYFIAVIHNMESSLNFKKHLHNGDPLTARTKQVPAGRPSTGQPPFTWEESAVDALQMKKLDKCTDWTIPFLLYRLEAYNGFGYRMYHPDVNSPYLWAGTDWYDSGKYVADGKFDPNAVSKQLGCCAILKRMVDKKIIEVQSATKF